MKKLIYSLLFILLILIPVSGFAADTESYAYAPEFHQSEARRMLDIVNAHRTSNGVEPLSYDCTLESAAMQRAAELPILYDPDHLRPDGSKCFTAFPTEYQTMPGAYMGENISKGYGSAESAFSGFRNSAPHNRNMLNANYRYAAFSCVTVNGTTYWVQHFHSHCINSQITTPQNGTERKVISVSKQLIGLKLSPTAITLEAGSGNNLPDAIRTVGNLLGGTIPVTWTVDNPGIAAVENGKLIWKSQGNTVLRAYDTAGHSASCSITCKTIPIYKATIQMPEETYYYTGSPIQPEPIITYEGELLQRDRDYTLTYSRYNGSDPYTPGRVDIDICGIGRFSSRAGECFMILKRPQTVTASISPQKLKLGQTAHITSSGIGEVSYWSDTGKVLISTDGTVLAYAAGKTTITVTYSGDSYTESASAQVVVEFEEIPSDKTSGSSSSGGSSSGSSSGSRTTTSTTSSSGSSTASTVSGSFSSTYKSAWLRVSAKGVSMGIFGTTLVLKKGKSIKINAKSNVKVRFKTSKKKVATVSSKGKIKAKKKGRATITITAGDLTYKVKVIVR